MTKQAKYFRYAKRGSVRQVLKCLDHKHARYRIDDRDRDGYTSLHHAARWGHTDLARALLARRANPNKQSDDDGDTPLHMALIYHHRSIAELLVSTGGVRTDLPNANGTVCDALLDAGLLHLKESRCTDNKTESADRKHSGKRRRDSISHKKMNRDFEDGDACRANNLRTKEKGSRRLKAYSVRSGSESDSADGMCKFRAQRSTPSSTLRKRSHVNAKLPGEPLTTAPRSVYSRSPTIEQVLRSPPQRSGVHSSPYQHSDPDIEDWSQQDWENDLRRAEASQIDGGKHHSDEERYYEALEREFRNDDYVGKVDHTPPGIRQQRDSKDWNERLLFEMGYDYDGESGFRGMDESYQKGFVGIAESNEAIPTEDWMEAIAQERRRRLQHARDAEEREKTRFANGKKRGAGKGTAHLDRDEAKGSGEGREDRESESKRRREDSHRIIREQEAETARKQQGLLAEHRLDYERRWDHFINRKEKGCDTNGDDAEGVDVQSELLVYDNIPWPYLGRQQIPALAPQPSSAMLDEKLMAMEKSVLMMGVSKSAEADLHKSRIRLEQRRWHPDKWPEALLHPDDKERVLQRVKQIAQMLNSEA